MIAYTNEPVCTDTFTIRYNAGSFDTITIAVSKSTIGGMVVRFNANNADLHVSNIVEVPRTRDYAETEFVHAIGSFMANNENGDADTLPIWETLHRLEEEYLDAYGY